MSDVADSDSPERTAEGRIEFEVRGTPGAPGPPRPYPALQSNKISMGWTPPKDDGGSPITHYEVQELRTSKSITCRTNECDFGGLENAQGLHVQGRGGEQGRPGGLEQRLQVGVRRHGARPGRRTSA